MHSSLKAKDKDSVPLEQVPPQRWVEVVAIRGGKGLQQRLADMGIGPGARLRVESSGRPGPFVVNVKGGRFVLGHSMVSRIGVKPASIPREEQVI